jgi:hypothetical protein
MENAMTIADAQADLRRAYVGGGPGLIVSGLFWLAAAAVQASYGTETAYLVLFFTGTLIFPSAILVRSMIFRRERERADNPLGRTALESTIAMIAGLVLAWLVLRIRPDWAFPFAAIAVGTHFFAFRTAYGDWRFWLLGAALTAIGAVELLDIVLLGKALPLVVGATEILFGLWLASDDVRNQSRRSAA